VIARRTGDRLHEGAALSGLGVAYNSLDQCGEAVQCDEQHLRIATEIGDRQGEGNAHWNMSLALEKLGKRPEAIAHAEEALRIFEQIESPHAKVRELLAQWRGEV
jgi:tetratricopeptide (TPR) repeat protein